MERVTIDDPIDEALDESFPASDAPSWTGFHAGAPAHEPSFDPEFFRLVDALRNQALSPDPLDAKTVELIAFACLVALGKDSARFHAVAAKLCGASRAELEHVMAIATATVGFDAFEIGNQIIRDVMK